MHRTNFLRTCVALCVAAAFTAPAFAQSQTLTLRHIQTDSSAYQVGAKAFAEAVEKASKGRYKVDVVNGPFPGGEKALLEKVKVGEVDFSLTSSGPVGNFAPEVLVTDIPFLFRDVNHARKTMDGPIGAEIAAKASAQGLPVLAWGENGFRHVTNNVRPVSNAADLKGLKLRTMENAVHMQAFRALGAFPEPLPFDQVVAALESNKLDGQENPVWVVISSKLGKVQKHLSLTAHVYSPAPFIASPVLLQKLPEADRAMFTKAAEVAAAALRKRVSEAEKAGIAELRAQGVQVVAEVDRASLEAAVVRAAYPQYEKRFGASTIERIKAVN